MPRRRFDALFLDFYGTLVTGDREAVEATCARIVDDLELPVTAADLAVAWGHRFFAAIETRNGDDFLTLFDCECVTLAETLVPWRRDIDPEPYARMLKAYWADPPAAPHVRETLETLDVPVCIVSNADTEDVLSAVEKRGFRVDAIVTSEDARSYKPHDGIFRMALERMQVTPDRVLHAGDSLHSDVGGAGPLGLATCWVCYADRIMDLGNAIPTHKISSIRDLAAILSA
ncbi:MAG TPA: HAD family hydrolase [Phycisphaerae bacterium]|nr:HAD family hydrolase [Phycisphaerales bacterium]HRX85613.1 HAD family hydrolase [Phycisphaerae bacterium]